MVYPHMSHREGYASHVNLRLRLAGRNSPTPHEDPFEHGYFTFPPSVDREGHQGSRRYLDFEQEMPRRRPPEVLRAARRPGTSPLGNERLGAPRPFQPSF